MLTSEIRSQIDQIWNAFWSGGISNPLEVIEQITYLLFIKRLDELQWRAGQESFDRTNPRRCWTKRREGCDLRRWSERRRGEASDSGIAPDRSSGDERNELCRPSETAIG